MWQAATKFRQENSRARYPDGKRKKRLAVTFLSWILGFVVLGSTLYLLVKENLLMNHSSAISESNMLTPFGDPVKDEVWRTLRALNDAWTKGHVEDLRNYFHKDMVAITATDHDRLVGREACFASWKSFVQSAKIRSWKEIDPQIQIYANTAVVTYYFDMSFDMDGKTTQVAGRDMFVFIKENGKWLAIADQFSEYPK